MKGSSSKASETPVFSYRMMIKLLVRTIIVVHLLFAAKSSFSQCVVYDGQGNAVNNPVWVSCSGGAYTLYLQSPNNLGYLIIDWGDGTPNTVVNGLVPPAFISHTYAATITNYTLTLTDTTNNCTLTGLVVMEEPVNASIQIPIGGVTQTCAPDILQFTNSSTDVSSNTVFTWDFGDGSPILTFGDTNAGQTITHEYLQGTVDCVTEVLLTAENFCSFGNPTEASFNPIQIYDIDDAQITADFQLLCYPDTVVHFDNTTAKNCVPEGNTAQRFEYWNFGDYWGVGSDSIIDWTPFDPPAKPGYDIAFPGIGTYTIMMADSNICGADTAFITVQIVDAPIAAMNVGVDSACTGDIVNVTNNSTGGNQSRIDWGDGTGFQNIGANGQHVYNAAGTYTISVVTNIVGGTNACTDTVQEDIVILPSPIPVANLSPAGGCDQAQVSFINGSSGGATYFWDFGNGDTSTLQNPLPILYTTEGQTPIVLEVTSSNGCVASDTAYVEIYDTPVADFELANVCEDALASFSDSSTVGYGGPVNQWLWQFGDTANSTSTLQHPTFTYTDSGTYTITFIASTPFCSDTVSQTIDVEAKPLASFNPSVDSGCSELVVTFTNTTTGAVNFLWDFGDGNSSTALSPTHTFIHNSISDTTFIITLYATSAFGCEDSIKDTVLVLGNPVASFASDAVLDCAPLEVNFSDSSINAISWTWDFGDSTGSTLQNPGTIFQNQTQFITNYTTTLVVVAPNGCIDSATEVITVYPEPLFNFEITPDSGCSPLEVNFPVAIGAVIYQWDFGDGNNATGPNPTHTYVNNTTNNQVFQAQLIATSPFGCVDTAVGDVVVFPLPNASFTPGSIQGCEPLDVNFVNTSTGGTNYIWEFGNGQTLPTNNITVSSTYPNNTNDTLFFYPQLKAISADGCVDSTTSEVRVFKQVEAAFTVPTPACHPYNASFTDQSVNAIGWDWDFDNGQFSNQQNPQIFFQNNGGTPQVFQVNLEVTSLENCTHDTTVDVTVLPKPTAIFSLISSPACHNEDVEISNTSLQNTVNTWQFGAGGIPFINNAASIDTSFNNFNNNPVDFPITLFVENSYGCSDTLEQTMQVLPFVESKFAAIDEGCAPFEVDFTNLSTGGSLFEWTFGDGQSSFLEEPTHTFVNTDSADITFQVVLNVTSPFGCEDADTLEILVHPTPLTQFTVNPLNQVFPDATVTLDNLTNLGPWSYFWEFGDDSTSSFMNPLTHTYETWGKYRITLTASSPFCEDTTSRAINIEPPLPIAEFDTLVEDCAPITVQFVNNSVYGVTFFWEFGDGATSNAINPSHTYQFAGTYNVKLTVTGPGGDVDSKEIQNCVVVNPQPLANFVFTPEQVNVPLETVMFINYSQFADAYIWDFGDGEGSEEVNPQHQYGGGGEFYPTLVAYTERGCSDTMIANLPVQAIEGGVVVIPNAFTPNPSAAPSSIYDPLAFNNQVFFPVLNGVTDQEYTMSIFNRWGELIFETHDPREGWNGYYRGKLCQQDVYVWKVTGFFVNGEKFNKVGDVTLIQ